MDEEVLRFIPRVGQVDGEVFQHRRQVQTEFPGDLRTGRFPGVGQRDFGGESLLNFEPIEVHFHVRQFQDQIVVPVSANGQFDEVRILDIDLDPAKRRRQVCNVPVHPGAFRGERRSR